MQNSNLSDLVYRMMYLLFVLSGSLLLLSITQLESLGSRGQYFPCYSIPDPGRRERMEGEKMRRRRREGGVVGQTGPTSGTEKEEG